jgi:hypothetical protein
LNNDFRIKFVLDEENIAINGALDFNKAERERES